MAVEARLKGRLYKVSLYLLKIIPMLLALISILNSILSFCGIDLCILSYIGGVSLLPILFLYVASYLFQFCECHRMFLHYVVITWLINLYDYYFTIPLTDLGYLCLQLIILGIILFIILYLHVTNSKKLINKDN